MRCWRPIPLLIALIGSAGAGAPATQPARLPHLEVDLARGQVRMRCEAVNAPAPLEFLVCAAGGPEHETVLRSRAKGSHLHLALLMLGLEPGRPAHIEQPGDRRVPPSGPKLRLTVEFERDGKTVRLEPHRLMRNLKSKKPLAPIEFVFVGSHLAADGRYAADVTGHLVSVVNFEYSVIDVAALRGSANETLEWETDPRAVPPRDSAVWLIIEPADKAAKDAPEAQERP